jgi:hypothetical protein
MRDVIVEESRRRNQERSLLWSCRQAAVRRRTGFPTSHELNDWEAKLSFGWVKPVTAGNARPEGGGAGLEGENFGTLEPATCETLLRLVPSSS